MVLVKSPLRMSFFGGGTDHPNWYRQFGGSVLSTTINQYVYIQLRQISKIFDYNYRILWSKIELAKFSSEIEHPVVRAVIDNYWNIDSGLEIIYNADLPSRSGLGSSSAFTVALIQGLYAEMGKIHTKKELANFAINLEQNILKESVGSQDQISASYGGLNRIDFLKNDEFIVTPMPITMSRRKTLEEHTMLFFTGFTRYADKIEKSKFKNIDSKFKILSRIQEHVIIAQNIILDESQNFDNFGELMNEAWKLKRLLSNDVSSNEIDNIYNKAIKAGALGGKILGAGGGGFFLFIVKPENKENVRHALKGFVEVTVKFESEGSRIIHYEPKTEH